MIDDMKFIIDGRQLLELATGNHKEIVKTIREKQMLFKTEQPVEESVEMVKKVLSKVNKEITI